MSVRRGLATLTIAALTTVSLAACNQANPSGSDSGATSASEPTEDTPTAEPVTITTNVKRRNVPVDKLVEIKADGGSLDKVSVSSTAGELAGKLGTDGTWLASDRLEPGTTYVVDTTATSDDGEEQTDRTKFSTVDLTLDQQTFASIAPLQGETVGVGMPVIVTFDVPVTDKASIEKEMTVTSKPAQQGSWHWISDTEAHWRPKTYWQAGTDVSVDLGINSVSAGGGVYGQEDRKMNFHVGSANVYKVNAKTDQMQVYSNGSLLRTIPITTGKPGFTTRSGVKVIIEKFAKKRMNSETIGIDPNSADGYDIDDVRWAMRLTFSGEFLHAAPWSVASQGHENVSHGCTGMSTENAKWLYDMSKRGDVVQYVGTNVGMTLTNGYGDWNESYADYSAGSAL
jgi:lipoprotein-anchoring transpeptidase ErfK/SrfK